MWGLGSGFGFQGSGFRVQGLGFRVSGFGLRAKGLGFRVQGSGFRTKGFGSRISARRQRAGRDGRVQMDVYLHALSHFLRPPSLPLSRCTVQQTRQVPPPVLLGLTRAASDSWARWMRAAACAPSHACCERAVS